MDMKFKEFLLNEEVSKLGDRVADVLSSAQNLEDDMENLGARHLTRLAKNVVNQIRKILHGSWSAKQKPHLAELQKIGVAIEKTIEERGELKEVLPAAVASLEQLSGRMGVKINTLDAPEEEGGDIQPQDFQLTAPTDQIPQPSQNQPPQQPQLPAPAPPPPPGPPAPAAPGSQQSFF